MAIIPTMDNEQTSPPHPPHAKLRPLISQLPNTHFLLFFSSPIYLKALLTRTKEKKQGKKSNKKSHVLKLFKAGISISGQPTRLLPSTPAMSTTSVHHTHPDAYAPPIIVILTVILLVFFFLGFFSVYFCRCFMGNLSHTWLGRSPSGTHGPGGSSAVHGLDPSIIDSFPTFVYSTVKDYREQKYGLECAICLSEFEDDDMLRLLTVCYHVFHHDCIDLWLGSHNTCPVCRRSLDVPLKSLEKSPANNNTMQDIDENESLDDECSIAIKDGDEECRGGSSTGGATNAHGLQIVENKEGKFSRSHSTGHSIAWTKGEEDKHTLILPEHVKAKITRGHNWSCTTFGDYSGHRNKGKGGVGEVSGFSGSNEDNV